MPGVAPLLAEYRLAAPKITEKEFKQKIRVKLGQNGLVELTEFMLEETFYEEVPVKKEENKDNKENKEESKEGDKIKEEPKTEMKPKSRNT